MMAAKKSRGQKGTTRPPEQKFGVLLEHIDGKFNQVLEGHAVLDRKIDSVQNELREFRSETTFKLNTITQVIDAFKTKTDANFKVVLEYLSRIDDEIQDLKKVFHGKPEMKRLMQLEARMAQVELVVKKFYGKNSN